MPCPPNTYTHTLSLSFPFLPLPSLLGCLEPPLRENILTEQQIFSTVYILLSSLLAHLINQFAQLTNYFSCFNFHLMGKFFKMQLSSHVFAQEEDGKTPLCGPFSDAHFQLPAVTWGGVRRWGKISSSSSCVSSVPCKHSCSPPTYFQG